MRKISLLLLPLFLLVMSGEVWSMNFSKSFAWRSLKSVLKREINADYSPIILPLKQAHEAFLSSDFKKLTILALASKNEVLNAKYGPDVIENLKNTTGLPNARDENGRSALHWAAINNWPLIEFLSQDIRLNPNERDNGGFTPLMHAVRNENYFAAVLTMLHPNTDFSEYFIDNTVEKRLIQNSPKEMQELFFKALKVSKNIIIINIEMKRIQGSSKRTRKVLEHLGVSENIGTYDRAIELLQNAKRNLIEELTLAISNSEQKRRSIDRD